MTIFVPVVLALSAVHEARRRMLFDDVNEFLSPDVVRRWKATFWICPKFSAQVTAGIVVRVVPAGQLHTIAMISRFRLIIALILSGLPLALVGIFRGKNSNNVALCDTL